MVINGSIHQKAIIITHILACNTKSQNVWSKTNKLRKEKDNANSVVIMWDFSTLLVMARTSKKITRK